MASGGILQSPTDGELVLRVGEFNLWPSRRLLEHRARPVRIGSRAFALLEALARRPGELVEKNDLQAAGWPKTFVHESNLKVTISALRRVLEVLTDGRDYIATIPGRGYVLTVPVTIDVVSFRDRIDRGPVSALPPAKRVVGRRTEIACVVGSLGRNRLTTIVGPGGIGKSTIGVEAAHASIAVFPDGVCFVDLSSVVEGRHVVATVLDALGGAGGGADALVEMAATLEGRRTLLVLDGCEHVLPDASMLVERLLSSSLAVTFLVTSREPLRLKGEALQRIEPLAFPRYDAEGEPSNDQTHAAVELLSLRVSELIGQPVPTTDLPMLGRIAAELDGVPLALELAAPHVADLGADGVMASLADHLPDLRDLSGSVPARQRSLAATLEWSYGMLEPNEAAVLRSAAMFTGDFDVSAGVAVASHLPLEDLEIADGLHDLSTKSLIAKRFENGRVLYRLFQSTRMFAIDHLERNDERQVAALGHAAHVLEMLSFGRTRGSNGPEPVWLGLVAPEINDVRAALSWALGAKGHERMAVALAVASLPLWCQLSLMEECRDVSMRGLAILRNERIDDEPSRTRLLIGSAAGSTYSLDGIAESVEAWSAAIGAARPAGDLEALVRGLSGLARYEMIVGRHVDARAKIEELRSVASGGNDVDAVEEGELLLACVDLYTGRPVAARDRLAPLTVDAPGRSRRSVMGRFQVDPSTQLGTTFAMATWLTGDRAQARGLADSAIRDARRAGHRPSLCYAIARSGFALAAWDGEVDRMAAYAAEFDLAVTRYRLDAWLPVAHAMNSLAGFWRGEVVDSDHWIDVRDRLADLPVAFVAPMFLMMVAQALILREEYREAAVALGTARTKMEASQQELWLVPELLRLEAAVMSAIGRQAPADDALAAARVAAERMSATTWSLRVRGGVGNG